MTEIPVTWTFAPEGELITALKTKRYKHEPYMAWIRKQKCISCPARVDVTASHLGRGYHGLKNHDWTCVPMCPSCHWLYEYHKTEYQRKFGFTPEISDAEKYFQKFLVTSGREDDRTEEQKRPI
jgi:hypothetical protein